MPDAFIHSSLLLAGGQGSRMAGRDKGLMDFNGEPVAAHLSRLLRSLGGELLISCNRNQAAYAAFADRLVMDDEANFSGPLAGILAGLRDCNGSHLLVLPCDMPKVDQVLLQALLIRAAEQPQRPCMVRSGESWQPLLCVIPRLLLPQMEAAWQCGERSPLRWQLAQNAGFLRLEESDARLQNANSLEDWGEL